MDIHQYKQRLLQLQDQIGARLKRELQLGGEQVRDVSGDAGDESVTDEGAAEDFMEAELDATVLQQVEDALKRIDDGTFGQCTVDGGVIEPKRLDAMPWTPYCLAHQRLSEVTAHRQPTM